MAEPRGRIGFDVLIVVTCIGVAGCVGTGAKDVRGDELARCAARGSPVTLGKLVEVFRANGITLDINRPECRKSTSDATREDATNFGPSGLDKRADVARREGDVLCTLESKSVGPNVSVVRYPGDQETYLRALNVDCSLYPSDAASEHRQVARVKSALEAVVRATPGAR